MITYKIVTDVLGKGIFEIDGKDAASQIMGATINIGLNKATEIYLQMVPGALELEGEGIVYVLSGNSVKKFLDGLDPEVVKAEALNSMGMGGMGSDDPLLALIEVIKKLGDEFDANQS